MIYPQIDIILSTVNKYNSKLLAFNRVFKSHYYMFKSTEISTFISPDYVLNIISSPLFLFLCSLLVSSKLLLSASFSISHAGADTVTKSLSGKWLESRPGRNSLDKSPKLRQMLPEKRGQTNSGFYNQPCQDDEILITTAVTAPFMQIF